jgi:Fe-S-cluster containining protein
MPALTPELEKLCSECGLCCDGSLFTFVPVSPTEAERLKGKLEFFTRKAGDQALQQPCAALEGTCCRVYPERPLACRDFVCTLWKALDEGEARLDEALGLVARAHALIRAIRETEPSLPTTGTLNAARRMLRADEGPAMSAEGREALRQAEHHLRFHFGWKG